MSNDKKCFVIMPFTDPDGYENGHFDNVYQYLIKPACEDAGLEAVREDDDERSKVIHHSMIKKIMDYPYAICDISSKNPNVLYELGVRHAIEKNVVIIKDNKTESIFNINIQNIINYDLDVSKLDEAKEKIKTQLLNTDNDSDQSIISLIKKIKSGIFSENKNTFAKELYLEMKKNDLGQEQYKTLYYCQEVLHNISLKNKHDISKNKEEIKNQLKDISDKLIKLNETSENHTMMIHSAELLISMHSYISENLKMPELLDF